ncbi:hypothetical protein HOK51_04875 [Candidatus Woesearchaeota archaeon]|jgi:hypothetical protein|nr:hypothetical protein [Candidatus Woesearchaeota archaeon]MBT6519159.1 hypothetical protein [Candidatus Woesearchaeota archaeon]MBT7368031.1 hypothetical protein [Candidatus Woesearchaeota archaeon]
MTEQDNAKIEGADVVQEEKESVQPSSQSQKPKQPSARRIRRVIKSVMGSGQKSVPKKIGDVGKYEKVDPFALAAVKRMGFTTESEPLLKRLEDDSGIEDVLVFRHVYNAARKKGDAKLVSQLSNMFDNPDIKSYELGLYAFRVLHDNLSADELEKALDKTKKEIFREHAETLDRELTKKENDIVSGVRYESFRNKKIFTNVLFGVMVAAGLAGTTYFFATSEVENKKQELEQKQQEFEQDWYDKKEKDLNEKWQTGGVPGVPPATSEVEELKLEDLVIPEKAFTEKYIALTANETADSELKKINAMGEVVDPADPETETELKNKVKAMADFSKKYKGTNAAFMSDHKRLVLQYLNPDVFVKDHIEKLSDDATKDQIAKAHALAKQKANEAIKVDFKTFVSDYKDTKELSTNVLTEVIKRIYRIECAGLDKCSSQELRTKAAALTTKWVETVIQENEGSMATAELDFILAKAYMGGNLSIPSAYDADSNSVITLDPKFAESIVKNGNKAAERLEHGMYGGHLRVSRALYFLAKVQPEVAEEAKHFKASYVHGQEIEGNLGTWVAEAGFLAGQKLEEIEMPDQAKEIYGSVVESHPNSKYKAKSQEEIDNFAKEAEEKKQKQKKELREFLERDVGASLDSKVVQTEYFV